MLSVSISIDKITMYFKGQHSEKIIMTYKSEGYGLQEDDIFQKGCIYQIFICTDTAPKTYFFKRLLPLHDIVMTLFSNV